MIKLNHKEVEFKQFPNNETYFNHNELKMTNDIQKLYFKYENDSDLIKLMMLKNYLDDMLYDDTVLFVSYMPYSRMDRSENNSPFTLKYISNFINQLNFRAVVVVEPHSDVTPALLNKCLPKFINFELITKVMDEIDFHFEKDYVFFPDAGAQKRYATMKGFKQLVGYKHRNFETGKIEYLKVVGDAEVTKDSKALIVDDLSSRGGTFMHSAKALKDMGFKEVHLLVAHAEETILFGEIPESDLIDSVFTTDTIISRGMDGYKNKFKIYDIEELLQ